MKILIPIILILFLILIFLSINENFDNIGYSTCISQQNNVLGPSTTIQTDLVNLDIFIDNVIDMINKQRYNLNNLDLMNMKELLKKAMDDVNTGYNFLEDKGVDDAGSFSLDKMNEKMRELKLKCPKAS